MSCFTYILNSFANKAVAAFTNGHSCCRHIFISMHLHRHIDIVKSTFINKLPLTSKKMQFAFFDQFITVSKFYIFLSRDAKKYGIT